MSIMTSTHDLPPELRELQLETEDLEIVRHVPHKSRTGRSGPFSLLPFPAPARPICYASVHDPEFNSPRLSEQWSSTCSPVPYAENDVPQPQLDFALGLLKVNPPVSPSVT